MDWVEAWNARLLVGDGNARAAELARTAGVPGVAVSDAHTTIEVGVASTVLQGDPSTPDGLLAALAAGPRLVTGRASVYVRLVTPVAKAVQRARGRGRVATGARPRCAGRTVPHVDGDAVTAASPRSRPTSSRSGAGCASHGRSSRSSCR